MAETRLQKWINLFDVLKWPLLFAGILLYLPLTAFSPVPGYSLLGGMFLELGLWAVFWVSFAFCAAAWSLMFNVGLLVEGAAQRLASPDERPQAAGRIQPFLPRWAVKQLSLPVSRRLLLAANALAAVGGVIVAAFSTRPWWIALPVGLGGGLVAYTLMVVLTLPVRLACRDQGYDPLPRSHLGAWLWRLADRPRLARWAGAVRRLVSRLVAAMRMRYLLEPGVEPPRMLPNHFFAFSNLVGVLVILGVFGWYFFPPRHGSIEAPAAAFLYVLVVLLMWTLLGIDFHLSRLRVSPVLILVALMVAVFTLDDTDHYYAVRRQPPADELLTPVAVAAASRQPENLVVVASAGGGILAAGWTALALENLVADRPALADEIRLLSTVSGGSVGAAFYVDALRDGPDLAHLGSDEAYGFLDCVYRRATASSLASAAYGFAFLDFWRLFVGGWPPWLQHWDRGTLLERAWARHAAEPCAVGGGIATQRWDVTLSDLEPAVRAGRMPAVILNATVMETGHRLMQTPMQFAPPPDGLPRDEVRAQTLSELLFGAGASVADPTLWTAARMSATFPYVSPAARAEIHGSSDGGAKRPAGTAALHLIDGGYYDNFGIASTLDWLQPVLRARLGVAGTDGSAGAGETEPGAGLAFSKVLVIQLNPFAATDPDRVRPVPGSVAALFGPVVGLVAIQNGVAITRNRIDLRRFLAGWNARFHAAGLDVCLATVEMRPPEGTDEPLSWHLTQAQIADQRASWPRRREQAPPDIRASWDAMTAFLEGPCPPRQASEPAEVELGAATTTD